MKPTLNPGQRDYLDYFRAFVRGLVRRGLKSPEEAEAEVAQLRVTLAATDRPKRVRR